MLYSFFSSMFHFFSLYVAFEIISIALYSDSLLSSAMSNFPLYVYPRRYTFHV